MLSAIRPILALLLSHGLLVSANGMFASLLGLRSKLEGFSTETTGIIMAGTFVGMLIGAVYAVRMVGMVGHIRAFAALASILSVAVLSHVLRIDPVTWFLLRVVAGFCISGLSLIVESWLNESATNQSRGQILSMYMITNYLGYGVGQFLLLLDHPKETQLFMIASIVLSLALVPILMTKSKAPTPQVAERLSLKKLFMISPLGVVGVLVAGMINSPINSMGAVFGEEAGLPLSQISTLVACFICGGMLLQYPVGRISDKLDRRTVILVVCILAAIMALGVIWALDQSAHILFVAALAYGAVAYTIYPLSSAQLNDMADKSLRVQVAAGMMITYGVGAIFGPIVSSQAMGIFGAKGLFYYIFILTIAMMLFTILRMISRTPTKGTQRRKSVFLPISGVGVNTKQLYNATFDAVMRERRRKPRAAPENKSEKMPEKTPEKRTENPDIEENK